MERLTEGQKARAVRLLAILKLGFADHGKASTLLRSYTETGGQSGFEAIRLLAREFSVRSRQELLHYRSTCLEKSVKGSGIQDIVRRIDLNFLQYQKVVEALDPAIPTNGIELSDPDKCMLLLRSLPADCRSHIVLQFRRGTETYRGYVDAALDYENHQRMWADLPGGKVNEMYADPAEGADDEDDQLARLQGGPKRVADKNTVCFNCNGKGHFSRDCPKPRRDGGASASSKDKPKPKAKPGGKSGGKGKGRGKGKKAHELTEEGGEPDAEEQVEDQTAPTEEAWSEVGESEEPSRLSMLQLAEAHMKDERAASDEAGWWMLDSGASRTVISRRSLHFYTINRSRKLNPPMVFFTASGERVEIEDEVVVVARFRMTSEPKSKTLEIRALVSDVQHNLLSVGQCVSRGWNFHYTQDEVVLETPGGDSVRFVFGQVARGSGASQGRLGRRCDSMLRCRMHQVMLM